MRPADVHWYASGAGLARSGPYRSQMEAYLAMRLTEDARLNQRKTHGTDSPYPHDLVVWPEPAQTREDIRGNKVQQAEEAIERLSRLQVKP